MHVANVKYNITSSRLSRSCPTGYGAVLNASGEVELDAMIMNGQTLTSGAVAAVQNISNPVALARLVLEKVRGWGCTVEHL